MRSRRNRHYSPSSRTSSRHPLSDIRVVQRNLVYVINIHQDFADECILVQPSLFGQYGKIKSISVKRNKSHSKKHYDVAVYSAYITFKTEVEASLCILSVDKFELGGQKLGVSYGMTKYCSYFLDGQTCRNDKCLFLHATAAEEDSFSLYDKQGRGYPTRSSQKEIFDLIGKVGEDIFGEYLRGVQKISRKMQKEEEEAGDFHSSEEELEKLPSPLNLVEILKKEKPGLFKVKEKILREGGSVKPNLEKANDFQVNKSWHFASLKEGGVKRREDTEGGRNGKNNQSKGNAKVIIKKEKTFRKRRNLKRRSKLQNGKTNQDLERGRHWRVLPR